jgi:DNA-binding PadR family transcriptional regulator
MAKRRPSNLLPLAVLSLLGERPMHPYEIAAVMRMRELTSIVKVSQSSLYAAIEACQRDGLIVPVETQRVGRYPERTVYAVTDAGRAELAAGLRTLLREHVPEGSSFAAGLAFMGNLPPDEVAALLDEHTRTLEAALAGAHATIERARQYGVDRLFLVEDAYAATLLDARLGFVRQLVREINDGTLTELAGGQRRWKVLRPELALLQDQQDGEQDGAPPEQGSPSAGQD